MAYDITNYNALLKPIIKAGVTKVLPAPALFQKLYGFSKEDKVGSQFEFLVRLKNGQGHSFNGTTPTMAALASPINATSQRAVVVPSEYIYRDQIAYAILSRGSDSEGAVQTALKHFTDGAVMSAKNALEITAIHGQRSLATVGSLSGQVVTFSKFSPGLLSALDGAKVDFYNGSTPIQTGLTIASVDVDAGTATMTGTTTSIASTHKMYYAGAYNGTTFNEQLGLLSQIETASGTVFGISKTINAWKGSVLTSVGTLTPTKVNQAVAKSMNKGFGGGVMHLWVSPTIWGNLSATLAGSRVLDSSYSEAEYKAGVENVSFKMMNAKVVLMAHPFFFDSEALLVPAEDVSRKGSAELSLNPPGIKPGEELINVQGQNGCELQCYSDVQIVDMCPAHAVLLTGITG